MKPVLYVEDSATAQLIMRKCLGALCELTIVSTLAGALQWLGERPFDLLITDFLFPEGDALGLIEHTRRTQRWDKLPIIVVSASMDRMLVSRVLRAGANEALCKPLIPEEFRALIARMLEAPYLRSPGAAVNGVSCFQWRADGRFHQYCPELNLAVSGATKAEAASRMKTQLHEHAERGVALGAISHETVVTHVVHEQFIPAR